MSTINTFIQVQHQDTSMSFSVNSTRTTVESGFSTSSISVGTADETISTAEFISPRSIMLRLMSGDDVKVGLDGATYPFRLSGADDSMILRLDVEGIREISSITCGADTASSLSGDYFDLTDRTGTVRVWFNMAATAAFGSITYGAPAAAVKAAGVLTLVANPSDNDTVTVGATTYTFKTALTPAANEVLIGAAATDSIDNLIAAITAGAGSGTLYGAGTTANASATATAGTGDTMNVESLTAGHAGNSIATTEAFTDAGNVFGAATLAGGYNRTAVVVNGTTLSYVSSSPGANEFSSISELTTLVDALASISATDNGTTISIVADTAGTAGNSITLALGANINPASTLAVSGATLTGGTAASTPPATPGGGRLIPVVIDEDDANTVVAAAVQAALDADAEFSATLATATVTVTDTYLGTRTDVSAGTTGWTVSTVQQGAASPAIHLKSAGTSQVLVGIAPN